MKLYPDGIAEGTPEECAAFKHIDAALTARNARKAIEPKPKAKTNGHPSAATVKEYRAKVRAWARRHESALGYTVGEKGIVPRDAYAKYEQAHVNH